MRTYLILLANFIILATGFGLICPFLISAQSTIAVLGGIIYLALIMPFMIYFLNKWFPIVKSESVVSRINEVIK